LACSGIIWLGDAGRNCLLGGLGPWSEISSEIVEAYINWAFLDDLMEELMQRPESFETVLGAEITGSQLQLNAFGALHRSLLATVSVLTGFILHVVHHLKY
jgi:hypothetical protein